MSEENESAWKVKNFKQIEAMVSLATDSFLNTEANFSFVPDTIINMTIKPKL